MSIRHLPRGKARHGFTLAEMLFAMAIGTFILTGVMTSYVLCMRGFRRLSNYNEMQADGRHAVDWFARDIRAGLRVSSWLSNRVVVLTPSAVNNAGVVTTTNVVTHTLTGGAWCRTTAAGDFNELAPGLRSLTFSLYDQAGNITMQASQAVSVQVDAFLTNRVQSTTQSADFLSARYRMRNTP